MARQIPADRMDGLIRAATEVFIARGYRLTQMSDIAEAVGVAKGTLYGYVESKDALLFLCLAHADQTGRIPIPETLPVASLGAGVLSHFVKEALAREVSLPLLEAAVARTELDDLVAEARGVVGEVFDLMARHRYAIKLLDRCVDHPELADHWRSQGRAGPRLAVQRYVESRIRSGHFRPVADAPITSRIVIENCATWAVHIHWDRTPEAYDSVVARESLIEFVVAGLVQ